MIPYAEFLKLFTCDEDTHQMYVYTIDKETGTEALKQKKIYSLAQLPDCVSCVETKEDQVFYIKDGNVFKVFPDSWWLSNMKKNYVTSITVEENGFTVVGMKYIP